MTGGEPARVISELPTREIPKDPTLDYVASELGVSPSDLRGYLGFRRLADRMDGEFSLEDFFPEEVTTLCARVAKAVFAHEDQRYAHDLLTALYQSENKKQ